MLIICIYKSQTGFQTGLTGISSLRETLVVEKEQKVLSQHFLSLPYAVHSSEQENREGGRE